MIASSSGDAESPKFDRYVEASTSHHALQAERGEIGKIDDLNPDQLTDLDEVEIALELAGVELGAARIAYLDEQPVIHHPE
jgi:hypothetical protein